MDKGYSTRKINLPNIKLHKKSRSPDSYKFVTPEVHNLLIQKISNEKEFSPYKSVDCAFRPGSIDLTSRNEQIVDKTFSARYNAGEKPSVRRISPEVPTLRYGNIIMSRDLAVMAQVRRSMIGEISSNKIPYLTTENLPQIRNSFCPKELQNIGDSQQLVQRIKANTERKARHPYATGAYAIKALNPKVQKQIIDKLRVSLPEGSRFFQYL